MRDKLLQVVKWRLGITTNIKDEFITFLIESTLKEMKSQHKMELTDENHEEKAELREFIVDYVCYKYNNTEYKGMPRFLQLKLHNLKINRMRK